MKILVTGAAGFIGHHLSQRLLEENHHVIGLDNLNPYYDPNLKMQRLRILDKHPNFTFTKISLEDKIALNRLFQVYKFDKVLHLAAQAGVRHSITHPEITVSSNLLGFGNIIECVRQYDIRHFLFASSSSVYGGNINMQFTEKDTTTTPLSLYAATKLANEHMAYSYSHLYKIATTGFRFFTAYGPLGRPDMALSIFANAINNSEPIDVYNNGNMQRDFTYISDIIDGIMLAVDKPFSYEIFNLASGQSTPLEYFIDLITNTLGKKAIRNYLPLQPGDVPRTWGNISKAYTLLHYLPKVPIEQGVKFTLQHPGDNYI